MSFTIRTEDNLLTHGFDIGELVLTDPKTGKSSTLQSGKKCYMVYDELSVLLDEAVASKINRSVGTYMLPSGNSVKFDGKANSAVLAFSNLEVVQSLDATIDDLRRVIESSLERLETESDENDVMIAQLREGLEDSANI